MDLAQRAEVAAAAFRQGDQLAAAGRHTDARSAYTAGHDVVLDLPLLHRAAHERLLPVHRALGLKRDVLEDQLLLLLAPLGVFVLAAWVSLIRARLRGRALYPA